MIKVTENFRKIQDLLAAAAKSAGRSPDHIRLVAASKRQPIEAINALAAEGQRDFGENTVTEGVQKVKETARQDLTWHFIGHLQANKTRRVAEHFDWVHTVDRLRVAERLSKQRPHYAAPLNVLIQVNIDAEPNKSGVSVDLLPSLALAVAELPRLSLRGLMCLPARRSEFCEQRTPFARTRALFVALNADNLALDTLSMGMSEDFAAAIHEGATIVRIGTALFGPRDQ